MNKKRIWTIIIGIVIILAVPTSILLSNYLNNKNEDLIDVSGNQFINPTPESNITLSYSFKENLIQNKYIYQFEFIFKIIEGIELNFTWNDRIYNNSQIYLSIKANYGLEFYAAFLVMNMTEFHGNNSQLYFQKEMESPLRFENVVVELNMMSISEGEYSNTGIGGGITLFQKEQYITVEDISDFSGNMYFWINENEYNLSYEIFPDLSIYYTLNSTVGDLELDIGQIIIQAINGSSGTGIGSIYFPHSPGLQGYHSESVNFTLRKDYEHLSFHFIIGMNFIGSDMYYEIIPYSELLDQIKTERTDLLKKILNNTLIAILIVGAILGCMIADNKKI